MKIVSRIAEIKELIHQAKQQGQSVALVATMGYLHEGHLTLMRKAKAENAVVVASIFVNPIQFGPNEDFEKYPRDLKKDSELAQSAGVDILFAPEVQDMYPMGYHNIFAYVDVQDITECLCGASRPGHFRGVATVVTKLFNIIEPDAAYFGQKDAQQVIVIKRMVADLNMNVNIVAVPIVREPDGLALSSRNVYLSPEERKAALVLSRSLVLAKEMLAGGERGVAQVTTAMRNLIAAESLAAIDYVEIRDYADLKEVTTIDRPVLIALAVKIGRTRLIDNIIWEA